MEISYTNYEPESGFEEKQALIYNAAIEPYGGTPVTADSISQRIKRDKPDFNGIRFALKADDSPLVYCQYRANHQTRIVRIGYPWAVPETPEEVQEKLFSELFVYVQEKYPDYKYQMGYINENYLPMHDFANAKGFVENNRSGFYTFGLESAKNVQYPDYQTRIAVEDDVEDLVELVRSDPFMVTLFSDDSQATTYFKERVIPDGHTVIVQNKDGQFLAAAAPLTGYRKDSTLIRFNATREGFEPAFMTLIAGLASHIQDKKLSDQPLGVSVTKSREFIYNFVINDLESTKVSGSILHQYSK